MRDYNGFITTAFIGYDIPPQILQVVRDWVVKECGDGFWDVEDDLGYAELAKVTDFDQAMRLMAETLKFIKLDGNRQYNKFIKDAGGRVGKGFYRQTLKAYYLTETKETVE